MPKEKKVKKNDIENDALNSEESSAETDETSKDDFGSPTYEELVDINEELEKSVLRANADLDNALKRTVNEVEKAHKYGVEKLLVELLPVIDNLEHALNNLSENATKEDKEGMPSLSSLVAFSDRLFKACSRLSITGNSSTRSFSTPYLWAFSTSLTVLFNALSKSALALKTDFSNSSLISTSSS